MGEPDPEQEDRLLTIINRDVVDLVQLRRMAFDRGGFLTNELRSRVWPSLLGVNIFDLPHCERCGNILPCRCCRCAMTSEAEQIRLDIERSLWRLTEGSRETVRAYQRGQLASVIHCVLGRHPELRYYQVIGGWQALLQFALAQGFHDVCAIFLYVCGTRSACALVERVSTSLLAHAHEPTFASVQRILGLLFPLIGMADPPVHEFLIRSGSVSF